MTQIHIVTDSTCDLTDAEIKQHGVHMVPLSVQIDDITYTDRVNLQPDTFIELMRKAENLPKSSQPSPGAFKEVYDELGKDGSKVISIHMTGGMSGTYQSAVQAAEMSDTDVTVIDSRYIAFGLAFQLREAIRLRDAGASVEEIVAGVNKVRENTRLFVVLDTLENMVKGGRIGKGKAVVSSFLNIKPIGHLDIGEVTICAKPRSYKQVVKFLIGEFEKDTKGKVVKSVAISHAGAMDTLVNPLIEQLRAGSYNGEVEIAFTSPVISTHAGEGAIGFMYYAE